MVEIERKYLVRETVSKHIDKVKPLHITQAYLVNEKSKLNPLSLYAKSKIRIEKYLKKKSRNHKIKITILLNLI